MRPSYQHRLLPVSDFRAAGDGVAGRFTATVLTYNTVDDYMTAFMPGVFDESMATRMPRVVWSHDWSEPLGRWTEVADNTSERLRLVAQLDNFDFVPRARQAYHQMESGTIDQFSVGFMPTEMGVKEFPVGSKGEASQRIDTFIKGRLDEVSLVLVGAVYGTGDVALRFGQHPGRPHIRVQQVRQAVVDLDAAAGIVLDLQTGKMDLADALMALKQAGVETPQADGDPGPLTEPGPDPVMTVCPTCQQGPLPCADHPTSVDIAESNAADPPAAGDTPPADPSPSGVTSPGTPDGTGQDVARDNEIADALAVLEGL